MSLTYLPTEVHCSKALTKLASLRIEMWGTKKKKMKYTDYSFIQNGVSVQNGITQTMFRPREIAISFHSFHSKSSFMPLWQTRAAAIANTS